LLLLLLLLLLLRRLLVSAGVTVGIVLPRIKEGRKQGRRRRRASSSPPIVGHSTGRWCQRDICGSSWEGRRHSGDIHTAPSAAGWRERAHPLDLDGADRRGQGGRGAQDGRGRRRGRGRGRGGRPRRGHVLCRSRRCSLVLRADHFLHKMCAETEFRRTLQMQCSAKLEPHAVWAGPAREVCSSAVRLSMPEKHRPRLNGYQDIRMSSFQDQKNKINKNAAVFGAVDCTTTCPRQLVETADQVVWECYVAKVLPRDTSRGVCCRCLCHCAGSLAF